jgi:YegS/Rv2252/BmrU family lipid kinase
MSRDMHEPATVAAYTRGGPAETLVELEDGVPREAIVIASLHARRVRRQLVPALALLQEQGLRILAVHPLRDLTGVADIVAVARARGVRLVVTAGGDGTVGAAVNCMARSEMALGILPLGTSNDFARSLGLPLALPAACRAIAQGKPRLIDLGLLTTDDGAQTYFVHAAIVGLNTEFARLATRPDWRRRYGRFAYLAAAARALRNREAMEVRISADGMELHGRVLQVCAMNAPLFGGGLTMRLPHATLTDRRLDLLVIGDLSLRRLLQALRVQATHKIRRVPYTYFAHPSRIRIETTTPREIACDGELIGLTPAVMESADRALTIIGPPLVAGSPTLQV